jgi:hypothetical protein
MSIPVTSNNMPNLLDNLHKITEDLQQCNLHQEPQLKLHYANTSYLSKSEAIQQLEDNSPPKPRHAKITYYEGIVSRNIEIFQKYIDQRHQNLSL